MSRVARNRSRPDPSLPPLEASGEPSASLPIAKERTDSALCCEVLSQEAETHAVLRDVSLVKPFD